MFCLCFFNRCGGWLWRGLPDRSSRLNRNGLPDRISLRNRLFHLRRLRRPGQFKKNRVFFKVSHSPVANFQNQIKKRRLNTAAGSKLNAGAAFVAGDIGANDVQYRIAIYFKYLVISGGGYFHKNPGGQFIGSQRQRNFGEKRLIKMAGHLNFFQ